MKNLIIASILTLSMGFTNIGNAQTPKEQNCCKKKRECCQEKEACCTDKKAKNKQKTAECCVKKEACCESGGASCCQ